MSLNFELLGRQDFSDSISNASGMCKSRVLACTARTGPGPDSALSSSDGSSLPLDAIPLLSTVTFAVFLDVMTTL